jgi:hypothetical protein
MRIQAPPTPRLRLLIGDANGKNETFVPNLEHCVPNDDLQMPVAHYYLAAVIPLDVVSATSPQRSSSLRNSLVFWRAARPRRSDLIRVTI